MEKIIELDKKKIKSDKDRVKEILDRTSDKTLHFKSRLHEIAFYFSLADTHTIFDDELGIRRVHQKDVKKARSLRNAYLAYFHPDKQMEDSMDIDFNILSSDVGSTFNRVSGGKL